MRPNLRHFGDRFTDRFTVVEELSVRGGNSLRTAMAAAFATVVLGFASIACQAADPLKKLLIIGDKPDGVHPAETHEYMASARIVAELLKRDGRLEVNVVNGHEPWPDGPDLIRDADGVVLCVREGGVWVQQDPRRYEALSQLEARGGGLSAIHWAIGARNQKFIEGYQRLMGGIHGGPDRKLAVAKTKVAPGDDHPITRGLSPFEIRDEYYYKLKFAKDGKVIPILRAELAGGQETVSWAWERPDGGRSFGFAMMHFHANWKNEQCRRAVAQGVLWTMKQDVPEGGIDVGLSDEVFELK